MRALMLATVVVLMVGTFAATATADRFALFTLGDIKGEHVGDGFDGWMSAVAFEHNIPGITQATQLYQGNRPEQTESSYTCPGTYQGFAVTKWVDKHTIILLSACTHGQRFEEMQLALCNSVGGEVTREALFTLQDVRITSMTIMAPGSGERPDGVAQDKALMVMTLAPAVIASSFAEVKVP